MTYFPPDIVVPKVTRSYTRTPFTLYQPFTHTNCFFSSFVPHAVSHWNSLPESVVSSPSFANTHLQCIVCTKQLYFLISRVQLILAMLFCTHAYTELLLKKTKKQLFSYLCTVARYIPSDILGLDFAGGYLLRVIHQRNESRGVWHLITVQIYEIRFYIHSEQL